MVLHGWLTALGVLEAAAAGQDQLPPFPPPREKPWEEKEDGQQAA